MAPPKRVLSSLLLATVLPAPAAGFIFEFRKDPVPLSGSYWILSQVALQDDATSKQKPEVTLDLQTVVENAAAAPSITEKMGNVQVGFVHSAVFDSLAESESFCCRKADNCDHGANSFSITSKNKPGGHSAYSTTLKETNKKTFQVKGGTYYLFISNCGDSPLAGLKVTGKVTGMSSFGYLAVQELMRRDVVKYFGIATLAFALLYALYIGAFSVSDGRAVKYTLFLTMAVSAARQLGAEGYYYSVWNMSNVEGAAHWTSIVLAATQFCLTVTLYDFLCSQYYHMRYTTVADGSAESGVVLESGAKGGPTLQETLLLGLTNVAVFGATCFTLNSTPGLVDAIRPPAEFFKAATAPDSKATSAGSVGTPVSGGLLGLTTEDFICMGLILAVAWPVVTFIERKDYQVSNDFTTRVFRPLRTVLCIIAISQVALIMIFEFATSTKKFDNAEAADIQTGVTAASYEGGILCWYVVVAFYLYRWDSRTGEANYSVVSEKDLELATRVDLSDEDAAVEAYDPDKLASQYEKQGEARQLE
ncbi:unnamed protein product [Amoebophrya sp. A25]|nr:unnamed protein product [Amoebophrya sp. A25]|eukprot:GSA25T00013171001.1